MNQRDYLPCPECESGILNTRTIEISTYMGDAEDVLFECDNCESEFREYELCLECNGYIPMIRQGASEYCSRECWDKAQHPEPRELT